LSNLLKRLEFEMLELRKNSWKGTYNFEVIARKNDIDLSKVESEKRVKDFLSGYLVDSSQGELKLLSVWMDEYRNQINKCEHNE